MQAIATSRHIHLVHPLQLDHLSLPPINLTVALFLSKTFVQAHAATDVGMHGLLASQSCYHSVLPPSL